MEIKSEASNRLSFHLVNCCFVVVVYTVDGYALTRLSWKHLLLLWFMPAVAFSQPVAPWLICSF